MESLIKLAVALVLIIWLVALIDLCSRRDIDPHDKISWLVVLFLLNGIGGIIYLIFAPKAKLPNAGPQYKAPDYSNPIPSKQMPSWDAIESALSHTVPADSEPIPPPDFSDKQDDPTN